jgi:lipid-A-disaccharide synthase
METMKTYVDRVLVIFPFEEALYRDAGVNVQFVGHPLVDLAKSGQPREAFLNERGLVPTAPTIALLPGSRRNELDRTVPIMAATIPLIRARIPDAQFVVACAPAMADSLFAPLVADELDTQVVLVRERTDDVLAASDVVITASGTATIQCTLHEKPMVVVYRLSPLTYRLVKPFGHVDMYAMPNLVAGSRIVPELIQSDFTAERTAEEALKFLTDRELYERTRQTLAHVRQQLGPPGASARAAEAVLEVAHGSQSARGSND